MSVDQDQFRAIVSGRRGDVSARIARRLLRLISVGYRLVVGVRNRLYDLGWLKAHRVDAVVICVGNVTTGGTGKTPLVAWVVKWLSSQGLNVAILTRGYKSHSKETVGGAHPTDEPAELASVVPGVPVMVNPNRVAGATEAIRNHGAQVLVMDDGFQHRRLARDLDIVAIDATNPFGYGHLLPAGLLREPLTGLKRAHAIVITRSDQVSEEKKHRIEEEIGRINPDLTIVRAIHAPVAARDTDGSEIDLGQLKNKRVYAFCGLGNPKAFFQTVESCQCVLAGSQVFNDHHAYTVACLTSISDQAHSCGAELILTTQKDWTKITGLSPDSPPLRWAYLAVELRFTPTNDPLTNLIQRTLNGRMAGS